MSIAIALFRFPSPQAPKPPSPTKKDPERWWEPLGARKGGAGLILIQGPAPRWWVQHVGLNCPPGPRGIGGRRAVAEIKKTCGAEAVRADDPGPWPGAFPVSSGGSLPGERILRPRVRRANPSARRPVLVPFFLNASLMPPAVRSEGGRLGLVSPLLARGACLVPFACAKGSYQLHPMLWPQFRHL